MSGRDIFNKLRYIILFFKILINIIPNFLLTFIWDSFSNSESKIILFFRYLYLTKNCKECGENVYIGRNVILKNMKKLSLGNNISIHSGTYIDAAGEIIIGDNVSIANQSSIISFEHSWEQKEIPIKYNKVILKKILIKNDVWIGTGCRILSGVTINSRSVVAAGAVVNKNVDSGIIVGGVPARKIKNIQ